MADIRELTSLDAPELDIYARLTDAQLRCRLEPEKGVLIAESPKVIGTALDAGYEPLSLLMERRQIEGPAGKLLARVGDVPVYTGSRELLAGLTGYVLTRGVLCAMRRPPLPTAEAVCAGAQRVGRAGRALSTPPTSARCSARRRRWGWTRFWSPRPAATPLLPAGRSASAWARCFRSPGRGSARDLPTGRTWGWRSCGRWASRPGPWPCGTMRRRWTGSVRAPASRSRSSWASEGDGLMPETVAGCDRAVRIPMAHGVDSLNVAAAAAIAFWQLRR